MTASSGGQSSSTTTGLTANTEALITLPGGTGSPSGPGYTPPPVEQPPTYIPPFELPKVPGAEFNYGIIILVGVVGVAVVVGIAGREKPSLETRWKKKTRFVGVSSGKWKKTKHTDLSRKWKKKMRRR